jgi:hypothetical protein
LQELAQRHDAEPDAALFEEPAPGDLPWVGLAIKMILAVHERASDPAMIS